MKRAEMKCEICCYYRLAWSEINYSVHCHCWNLKSICISQSVKFM